MSRVIYPFNNQPISSQTGTGTYTCPVGKYARVTVTLSAAAVGVPSFAGSPSSNIGNGSSDSSSAVFDIWVKSGDTVSGTLSNASASTASATAGFTSGTTTASYSVNSNVAGTIRATASVAHNSNAAAVSTVTGSSSFHYHAQEYNEIT